MGKGITGALGEEGAKMTFKEADKRLAKIADGGYRSIYFDLGTYQDGTQRTSVGLYIDKGSRTYHSGYHPTFKEAFSQLEAQMGNIEEIPEVSA